MGFASRLFILDQDDGLHRLPGNWFAQMLREPSSRPVPHFAGLRVRFADIIVELIDRKPARIVRLYWGYLRFDQNGVLDNEEFSKREVAKINSFLAAHLQEREASRPVIEAADRFTAAGGIWTPSPREEAEVCAAALGQRRCPRL
jgi:hypothetical protein